MDHEDGEMLKWIILRASSAAKLTSEHLVLRGRLHLEELKIPPVLTFSMFFASNFESSCAFCRSNVKAQLKKIIYLNEGCLCLLSNPEGPAVGRVRPDAEGGVSRPQLFIPEVFQ